MTLPKDVRAGDIVENWQGRRAVAQLVNDVVIVGDGEGVFKTPWEVIGTIEEEPFKSNPELVSKQSSKPAWYRGMKK